MNKSYFIEGLQGAGKSTYVKYLSDKLSNEKYTVYREGDYSPVELAWCAYLSGDQYKIVLEKYPEIRNDIHENTYREDDKYVVCYTKILTDIPGFHKYMEQFEIYNGNIDIDGYEDIILRRFSNWKGENEIFECSLLQNIIENDILFYEMSDDRIIDFYKKIADFLNGREYQIIYLVSKDIGKNIDVIEKKDVMKMEMKFGFL